MNITRRRFGVSVAGILPFIADREVRGDCVKAFRNRLGHGRYYARASEVR